MLDVRCVANPLPTVCIVLLVCCVAYVIYMHSVQIYMYCTYILVHTRILVQVPLGLVESLEMLASKDSFNVVCKDGRIFR